MTIWHELNSGNSKQSFVGGGSGESDDTVDRVLVADSEDSQDSKPLQLPFSWDSVTGSLRVDVIGTGVIQLPVGTTAERPGTPADGDLRVNSTTGNTECYRDTAWRNLEVTIGDEVRGVTAGRVLYADSSNNLADDTGLQFDPSTGLQVSRGGLVATFTNSANATSSVVAYLIGDRGNGNGQANDEAHVYMRLQTDDGLQTVAEHCWQITNVGSGTEESDQIFDVLKAGTLTEIFRISGDGVKVTGHSYQDSETSNAIVANAATIDLSAHNNQELNLGGATGAVTVTLTAPSGPTCGTLTIIQDDTARDITWVAGTGISTGRWLGTEPTWSSDTALLYRIISWKFDGTDIFLVATEEQSATF